jgi:hypothetical protein
MRSLFVNLGSASDGGAPWRVPQFRVRPAERSGDGALVHTTLSADTKAVSRFACHRAPHVRPANVLAVVAGSARSRELREFDFWRFMVHDALVNMLARRLTTRTGR